MVPGNTSCVSCTSLGQFKNNDLRICYACSSKCSVCTDENTCTRCNPKYYINAQKKCQPQKNLYAYLNQTKLPTEISIVFSDYYSFLMESLLFYMKISITGLDSSEYTWKANDDLQTKSIKNLVFRFNKFIDNSNLLQVDFNNTDGENDEFIFQNKSLSLTLQPYCLSPFVYIKSNFFHFIFDPFNSKMRNN
jgi:hypothetical protein